MKIHPTPVEWQRYQNLMLKNVSDVIIITDLAFDIISFNKVAEQFYALTTEEVIGHKLSSFIEHKFPHGDLQEFITSLQINKVWQGEISFTNKHGDTFYFLFTTEYLTDSDGNEAGVLYIGRNITEHRKAEEKLFKSEEFYRTLIADSLDVTMLVSISGEINFVTPSVKQLLGYDAGEIIGKNAFQYVYADDAKGAIPFFLQSADNDALQPSLIARVLKKDGQWLWCMIRTHNLLKNDNINAIVLYLHDDTMRQKANAAIKQSEKRFRTMIHDLQVGILLQNPAGNIEMVNQVTCSLFNLSEEEMLGKTINELFTDIIHEDGNAFEQEEIPCAKASISGKAVKDIVMGVWSTQKNCRLWIIINADYIRDEEGNLCYIVCSFTDITERKKMEKKMLSEKVDHQRQIAQATIDAQEKERLEIGKELHDNIGQQLTTIKLFLDLAKNTAQDQTMEMVNLASKGISDLINEVRHMSRSLVPSTLKDLGFVESISDLLEAVGNTQLITIKFDHFNFDEEKISENKQLSFFRIIQEQLNNIMKHASASQVSIHLYNKEEEDILQIKDDGVGFDFKKVKKGLGLANIITRAELFGGKAVITSQPGEGCMIEVCLPHNFVPSVFE